MYGVYKIVTWDDVSYTLLQKFDNEDDANNMCEELNRANREWRKDFNPVCYRVITDLQYYNLMH